MGPQNNALQLTAPAIWSAAAERGVGPSSGDRMTRRLPFLQALMLATLAATASAAALTPEATDYDTPPRLLKQKKPVYPTDAFKKRVEGTVLIEFTVDTKGQPRDLVVLESVPGLDDAALACVRQWRFTAALKNGQPAESKARAPVTFRIYDKPKK